MAIASTKIETTANVSSIGIPICAPSIFGKTFGGTPSNPTNMFFVVAWGDGTQTKYKDLSLAQIQSRNDIEKSEGLPNENDNSITLLHTYSTPGTYTIQVKGGWVTPSLPNGSSIAFAQRSKHDSNNIAQQVDTTPNSTPEKIAKIISSNQCYFHGQGDFFGFSNCIQINRGIFTRPIKSSDPSGSFSYSSSGKYVP